MSILTRIGDDARQQIEQAIRHAGISVVEALLVDAIRHLLPPGSDVGTQDATKAKDKAE